MSDGSEIRRIFVVRKMLNYFYHNLEYYYPSSCDKDRQLNLVNEAFLRMLCAAVFFFGKLDDRHASRLGDIVKDIYPELFDMKEINNVFQRLLCIDLLYVFNVSHVLTCTHTQEK